MKLEDVKKAIGKGADAPECALADKTVTLVYSSLATYSARTQSDMTALATLGKIASAAVDAHSAPAVPRAENIDAGVLTGPQRVTVVFV